MTIHDRVAAARERLRAADIPEAESDLDARLLAEHILGWDATRYFTDGNRQEPADFGPRYEALVDRRAGREPVAYIVGHQEFWGLQFAVSPAVLIPRPETELIVEAALEAFPDPAADLQVADVCTGTGCIAVSVAVERSHARLVATDLSREALTCAERNALRHGVAGRITMRHADLLDGTVGSFDLITANPPYVLERERTMLQPEVREHEPEIALFGGADGLDVIRRLVAAAPGHLRRGGLLIFEFGFGQDEAVEQIVAATNGLSLTALRSDLQGIPRTAVAERV